MCDTVSTPCCMLLVSSTLMWLVICASTPCFCDTNIFHAWSPPERWIPILLVLSSLLYFAVWFWWPSIITTMWHKATFLLFGRGVSHGCHTFPFCDNGISQQQPGMSANKHPDKIQPVQYLSWGLGCNSVCICIYHFVNEFQLNWTMLTQIPIDVVIPIATQLISMGTCHNLLIAWWHHDISQHQHKQTFSQHHSLSIEQLEFCLHACPSYVVWSPSPLLPVATLPSQHGYIREPSNPNMQTCTMPAPVHHYRSTVWSNENMWGSCWEFQRCCVLLATVWLLGCHLVAALLWMATGALSFKH